VLWVKKRSHPGFFIICLIFFWFFFIFLLLGSRFSDVRIFSGHMLQPGTFSDVLGLSDILRTYVAARSILGRSRTFGHSPDICRMSEHSRTFSDFWLLSKSLFGRPFGRDTPIFNTMKMVNILANIEIRN
jgi:hypothetical protein